MLNNSPSPLGSTFNSNLAGIIPAIPATPNIAGPGISLGRGQVALPPASQADPAVVADLVISSLIFDGIQTLRFWCGTWWYWSAGRYTEFSSDEVRCLVTQVFSQNYASVRSRHISDAIEHLKSKLLLNASLSPPAWIAAPVDWQPADCLPTRDSVVHLPTLVGFGDVAELGGEAAEIAADGLAANQPEAALDSLVKAAYGQWEVVPTGRRPRYEFILSALSAPTLFNHSADSRNTADSMGAENGLADPLPF